jgi:hypothetical protein
VRKPFTSYPPSSPNSHRATGDERATASTITQAPYATAAIRRAGLQRARHCRVSDPRTLAGLRRPVMPKSGCPVGRKSRQGVRLTLLPDCMDATRRVGT